jgi:Protein of unknown function (DUF1275)
VSYLALGHVFVANMTGNVVFLGFAVVDAEDFSVPASLTAIAAFLFGALAGGRLAAWHGAHRGRLLAATRVIETLLASLALALALVVSALVGRYLIIATLSIAMGLQNATARRLGRARSHHYGAHSYAYRLRRGLRPGGRHEPPPGPADDRDCVYVLGRRNRRAGAVAHRHRRGPGARPRASSHLLAASAPHWRRTGRLDRAMIKDVRSRTRTVSRYFNFNCEQLSDAYYQ